MKMKLLSYSLLFTFLFAFGISSNVNAQCQAGFTFTAGSASATFTNTSTGYSLPIYVWDFGDSQQNYIANPTHFFNAAGTYTVTLTVHDSLTLCQSSYSLPVTVTAGCNFISAYASTTNTTACNVCDGIATGLVSGGTAPYSYLWSNSSTLATQNNMCIGDYVLTVTDANGCASDANVHVGCPDSCHANFYINNVIATTVYLTNNSNDTSSNVQFQWLFGDATTSNLINPSMHTYAQSGNYTITLIMVDSLNSCSDTLSNVVTAGGPNSCYTSFSMVEDSFNLSQWYIYPTANGQAPFTYLWDFGDTTTSTQATPSHNYAYACHHVVCLTITDANSCISSYCDSSMVHRINSSSYMLSVTAMPIVVSGIQEQNELKGSVFPNPVSDFITVSFNKNISGTLRITDITGKLILENNFVGQAKQIDVSNLPQGIYNLSLIGDVANWNEKLVILR